MNHNKLIDRGIKPSTIMKDKAKDTADSNRI